MSWLFSRALVAECLVGICSDGEQSARLNSINMPQVFLYKDKTTSYFILSQYGMTYGILTAARGEKLLTWFRGDFLAKISAPPGQTEGPQDQDSMEVNQDFGLKCLESFAKLNHLGYWSKTPRILDQKDSIRLSKDWPKQGIMLRGESFQLKKSGPTTRESAYGSLLVKTMLPTPTAHNAKEGGYPAEGNRNTPTLGWVLGGKINPEYTEWMMGWPLGWTDLKPLATDKFLAWRQQHGGF